MMTTPNYTFTAYTALCRGCGRVFRITQQSLDIARAEWSYPEEDPNPSDETLANSCFDFCLACVGIPVPGEHLNEDT